MQKEINKNVVKNWILSYEEMASSDLWIVKFLHILYEFFFCDWLGSNVLQRPNWQKLFKTILALLYRNGIILKLSLQ